LDRLRIKFLNIEINRVAKLKNQILFTERMFVNDVAVDNKILDKMTYLSYLECSMVCSREM